MHLKLDLFVGSVDDFAATFRTELQDAGLVLGFALVLALVVYVGLVAGAQQLAEVRWHLF